MRRRGFLLLCLLALSGLARRASATGSAPADTIRILFIGNSYTYFNNLPAMLAALAVAGKQRPVKAEMLTVGGATLRSLWDEGTALRRIREGHWTFVVLQEQSTLGAMTMVDGVPQVGDPTAFHVSVGRFDAEIKKAGARTLLYLTWARRHHPEAQPLLTDAYRTIGAKLGATAVPVGIAWERALQADSALVLHIADDSHPNPAGTYLAASVFYATIFKESPEGLPGRIIGVGITQDGVVEGDHGLVELVNVEAPLARRLQRVAWDVARADHR